MREREWKMEREGGRGGREEEEEGREGERNGCTRVRVRGRIKTVAANHGL